MNIISAYLKNLLDNNKYLILMRLLLGMYEFYYIQKSLLYRLLKNLYILKQSGQLWNKNVIAFYKSIIFK